MREAPDTHTRETLNGDAVPLEPHARALATLAPAPGERTIATYDSGGLPSRGASRMQAEIDAMHRRRRRRSWLVLIEVMLVLGVLALANLVVWELLRRGW